MNQITNEIAEDLLLFLNSEGELFPPHIEAVSSLISQTIFEGGGRDHLVSLIRNVDSMPSYQREYAIKKINSFFPPRSIFEEIKHQVSSWFDY